MREWLEWIKRQLAAPRGEPLPVAEPETRPGRKMSGEYFALYDYLERRYASTVVLTVVEIEDILGFALPDAARAQQAWWAEPSQDASSPSYRDAWKLAGRTARPNLGARTVVFERPV